METALPSTSQPNNANETISSFFGTSLGQYYLTIKSGDLDFNGEGYVSIKGSDLSFFNDKMESIYSIPVNTVISANTQGQNQDDITMTFEKEVYINAER
ncbi:MAG: hypothetical protein WKF88_01575 [Ferruginibacter sp.]